MTAGLPAALRRRDWEAAALYVLLGACQAGRLPLAPSLAAPLPAPPASVGRFAERSAAGRR